MKNIDLMSMTKGKLSGEEMGKLIMKHYFTDLLEGESLRQHRPRDLQPRLALLRASGRQATPAGVFHPHAHGRGYAGGVG